MFDEIDMVDKKEQNIELNQEDVELVDKVKEKKIDPSSVVDFKKSLRKRPKSARKMMRENDLKQRELSRIKPRDYDKNLIMQRQGRGGRSM